MNLAKAYEPKEYEKDIYDLWEQSGAFKPSDAKESFSIVMPPPNANANLHVGHTLMFAIQDILIRYHRMQGKSALWLPGADHAGFETQVVFEKQLAKEGKSRFDFSRENLYDQIFQFVEQNKDNFRGQFKTLGASVDWESFTFTLDDKVVATSYATFKKLWDDKLIYRGERLVNYCTFHGTSFADIEVEFKDVDSHIWSIAYPLSNGEGEVIVATTRPETMLGDTAVAVHPNDERYKAFIGKTVRLPLTNREIPVIADEMVDPEFGTGAVKITPAHDPNDFEVAERHDLPKIVVIDHTGIITHDMPAEYRGVSYIEARERVLSDLTSLGLLREQKPYKHSVGHCYKCGTIIQPMLMDQWFIDMQKLAAPAIKALRDNQITFYPSNKLDQVITYLKGVKDWNISRQIAWGIPIPAFQNVDNPDDWIFDTEVKSETISRENKTYRRDSDVFDTWFSSGQWPFATLGYPEDEKFKKYYPNSVMETGQDILFQWVARMICLGLYVTGEIPFETVYLHGMVRSEDGRKMSKSLGNVIDPQSVLDEFGSDALRMGIIAGRSAGYSAAYAPAKVIAGRNFCNKLWNIARYAEAIIGDEFSHENEHASPVTNADNWILGRLHEATDTITAHLEAYRFNEAYNALYHFVWDDLADWYIEASKTTPNHPLLAHILRDTLKLAHPFAPFVTETIWQTLTPNSESLLISQSWPTAAKFSKKSAEEFEQIKIIVTEIRNITNALGVRKPGLYFKHAPFLKDNSELLVKLAKLSRVAEVDDGRGMHLTSTTLECWLDIDSETAKAYIDKLQESSANYGASIERLEGRLANKSYVHGAPKAVVQQTKDQLKNEQALLAKVQQELASFAKLTD
jgi:valyl-tRNA synthetase